VEASDDRNVGNIFCPFRVSRKVNVDFLLVPSHLGGIKANLAGLPVAK
jgi:hypothetical protein